MSFQTLRDELERYAGQDLVLAIDSEDDRTILAKGRELAQVVRAAEKTGHAFFLAYAPPPEGISSIFIA